MAKLYETLARFARTGLALLGGILLISTFKILVYNGRSATTGQIMGAIFGLIWKALVPLIILAVIAIFCSRQKARFKYGLVAEREAERTKDYVVPFNIRGSILIGILFLASELGGTVAERMKLMTLGIVLMIIIEVIVFAKMFGLRRAPKPRTTGQRETKWQKIGGFFLGIGRAIGRNLGRSSWTGPEGGGPSSERRNNDESSDYATIYNHGSSEDRSTTTGSDEDGGTIYD